MPHWRSAMFWVWLFVGWLIASSGFSLMARIFGSFDHMTSIELWITGITVHVLGLGAGFALARRQAPAPRA